MVVVEIPSNPNCELADLRVFHDVEAPRVASQVFLARPGDGEGRAGEPEWHEVTGWTLAGAPCPALARRVDDSGEGLAVLVTGGDAGLRLRPVGKAGRWGMDEAEQWGAPFLLLADEPDTIVYKVVSDTFQAKSV